MRIARLRQLTQRGDTIVEVLIAIAIISMVLAGAFVMTNNSLQGSRGAQERTNAVKLVESQIELIKGLATTNSQAVFGAGVPASFCVNNAVAVVASTNAACTMNAAGAPTTAEPAYRISVTRSGNTFTVRNTWTTLRGNTTSNVQMSYRVYAN
jgi:prepilin-type N-terminal cleavage/methylation domain-containing protein